MTSILIVFVAASFVFFGTGCLFSKHLRIEFDRYGLERWRNTVGVFQLLGAAGLLAGFWIPWAALVGSGGLAVLMLLGVAVRAKIRDSFVQTLPALSYFILSAWLFIRVVIFGI